MSVLLGQYDVDVKMVEKPTIATTQNKGLFTTSYRSPIIVMIIFVKLLF